MFCSCDSSINEGKGVLGAFSHLQRERRKHHIHVATLRAQSEFSNLGIVSYNRLIMTSVKRHAEAKNDTLGPHWTHWISKAITKLVGRGCLLSV